jgi:hypothetical protein
MKAVLTFSYFNTDNNWWWAIDNIEVSALPREKLCVFTEDFEGLPLGPNVDESVAGDEVWTKTAPEGWTLDDTGPKHLRPAGPSTTARWWDSETRQPDGGIRKPGYGWRD